MPMIKFDDAPIGWQKIMRTIVNFYAPSLPLKYLEDHKNTPPDSANPFDKTN